MSEQISAEDYLKLFKTQNIDDEDKKSGKKEQKEEKEESDGSCASIKVCHSMEAIQKILSFYESIKDENDMDETERLIVEYMENNAYKHLINDYHHILTQHLNEEQTIKNAENFNAINEYLVKNIKCDIVSCKSLARNGRNREEMDEKSSDEEEGAVYVDILDNIHTFFVHGFDTGHRIKIEPEIDDESKGKEVNDDKEMSSILSVISSKQMNANRVKTNKYVTISHVEQINEDMVIYEGYLLKESKYLKSQRKRWMVLKGHHLFSYSTSNAYSAKEKYTEMFDLTLYDEVKCKENKFELVSNTNKTTNRLFIADCNEEMLRWVKFLENIIKSDKDEKEEKEKEEEEEEDKQHQYSFGHRWYYWSFYENNDDKDINGNPGCKYSDWFIKGFYSNLKEEITDVLPMNQYIFVTNKAIKILKESDVIKSKKSEKDHFHYGIEQGSTLSIAHLMSIIFYTDYNQFIVSFCKSFDKLNVDESDQEFKKRHSKFVNTSKLMRETVELFGNSWYSWKPWYCDEPIIPVFYRAASMMYFTSFIVKFASPTSVTRQLSIAARFADKDGLILELGQCAGSFWRPSYFNCSLISCHGVEDERLFIGGGPSSYIMLDGIRNIGAKRNYFHSVQGMRLFQVSIRGDSVTDAEKKRFSADGIEESKVIQKLINNENKIEDGDCNYVYRLFQKFVDQQTIIKIQMQWLHQDYAGFIKLLSFGTICQVFVNCKKIKVDYHDSDVNPSGFKELSMDFWKDLMKTLNKIYDSKHKIKKIELNSCILEDNLEFDQVLNLFNKQNWNYQLKQPNSYTHHIYTNPSYIEQEKLESKEDDKDCLIM